jgi:hypothetical protein
MAIGATRWAAFLLTPLLLAPAAAATAAADPMQQPSDLVGVWQMTGKGADGATVLRLGDGDAELYRGPHCRAGGGSWKALPTGQFGARLVLDQVDCVAALNGDDQLWNVVAFRVAGANRELLDEHGQVVRTLRPNVRDQYPAAVLTPERRGALDSPPTAPSRLIPGLTPTTPGELARAWTLPGPQGRDALMFLHPDGALVLADGCKRDAFGRWAAGPDGEFLAVVDRGGELCPAAESVRSWLLRAAGAHVVQAGAAPAGMVGVLQLYDQDGSQLGAMSGDPHHWF